jgi:hypothetical protein
MPNVLVAPPDAAADADFLRDTELHGTDAAELSLEHTTGVIQACEPTCLSWGSWKLVKAIPVRALLARIGVSVSNIWRKRHS